MSLLNEMLSNLDSRRESAVPDSEGLVVNPVEPRPRRWGGWVIALVLILVSGFVLNRYQLLNLPDSQDLPVVIQSDRGASVPLPDQPGRSPDSDRSTRVPEVEGDNADPVSHTSAEVAQEYTEASPTAQTLSGQTADAQHQPVEDQQSASEVVISNDPALQSVGVLTATQDVEPATSTGGQIAGQGNWYVLEQPPDYYTVQLVALQDEAMMLRYASDKGLTSPLYVETYNKGVNWYVLLLGIYPDNRTASDAIEAWNTSGKPKIKPWVRKLGTLQKMIVMPGPSMATRSSTDSPDQAREVERLLREAELALLLERLTSPAYDNAYDRYRRVLELVPDQPIALQGINRIVETYLKLARKHRDSGNLERAGWLIGRAERVSPGNPEIAAFRETIQTPVRSPASKTVPVRTPDALPVMETSEEQPGVKQASGIAKREKVLLEEVEKLLQQGSESEARRKLERFLVNHPGSPAVVEVLFRLYLQLDKPDLATQLLQHSGQLPASTATKLEAQLQIRQGNLTGAVKILEDGASRDQDDSYTALLAGLYQKLGRYTDAIRLYRELLSSEPENGAYWLGLAVSLDSLHQDEDARTAFQHTLDYGHYDGDVRQYIEQRLQALSR